MTTGKSHATKWRTNKLTALWAAARYEILMCLNYEVQFYQCHYYSPSLTNFLRGMVDTAFSKNN